MCRLVACVRQGNTFLGAYRLQYSGDLDILSQYDQPGHVITFLEIEDWITIGPLVLLRSIRCIRRRMVSAAWNTAMLHTDILLLLALQRARASADAAPAASKAA